MAVQDRLLTVDEFWELCRRPEYADKQLELIDGVLIEMTPASAILSILAAEISRLLGNYVREHDLGYVTGADGAFELAPDLVLAPDVGFVAKARVGTLPERFFKLAPDLAVEVVSPTDSVKAVQRKAARYLAHGTGLVWIVYLDDKTVDICRPAQEGDMIVQEVTLKGALDGGEALPGFVLPLADIFKALPGHEKNEAKDEDRNHA